MTAQQPAPTAFNQQIIDEFRTNEGRVGGMFEGAPLVLLSTTGARTGRPHTNPAAYMRDGERILVFASNAGRPKNPDWYHNLLADSRVTIEIGIGDGGVETYAAEAVPLEVRNATGSTRSKVNATRRSSHTRPTPRGPSR
jgi:deazaflavin-dependent oxidoreductase (nitroreductase family)